MEENAHYLQEPIGKLPQLLNSFLIQVGKSFRDSGRIDKAGPGLATIKAVNHQIIPQIHHDFHEALDEIEIALVNAKSVIHSELHAIQKARAQQEESANSAEIVSERNDQLSQNDTKGQALTSGDPFQGLSGQDQDPNSPMNGTNPSNSDGKDKVVANERLESETHGEGLSMEGLGVGSITDNLTTSPENLDAKLLEQSNNAVNEANGQQQQTTDIDLDSIFGDNTGVGNGDEFNFDIPDYANGNAVDGAADDPFAGLTTANSAADNQVQTGGSSNEDFNTLLPGLENYVNDDAEAQSMSAQDFDFTLPDGMTGLESAVNPETTGGAGKDVTSDQKADNPSNSKNITNDNNNNNNNNNNNSNSNTVNNVGNAGDLSTTNPGNGLPDLGQDLMMPLESNFEDNLFDDFDMGDGAMGGMDDLTMMGPGQFDDEWQF